MRKFIVLASVLLSLATARAAELMPTAAGTTWNYNATEESGDGNAPNHYTITRRFSGVQEMEGQKLLKLQTFSAGVLSKMELVAVDADGVQCIASSDKEGKIRILPKPEIIVPGKVETGASWIADGRFADFPSHQDWKVADAEEVSVPAGTFHAFRFHCQQTSPTSITFDRWFAPGIGFVKEETTMRSPTGDLLGRRTLELRNDPNVADAPSSDTKEKLIVGVSTGPVGKFETEFPSTVPNLYARWQGQGLHAATKIRAVWIAENVGNVAPPNYQIDDANTTAGSPDAHGLFTLSRPANGWAEGNYRVDFYLDGTLAESVKITIK